jgi:flavodoxin
MVINLIGSIWGKGELKQDMKPLDEHCKENSWDPHFFSI